jgi:diguanylate cyclase (GGDEF)-like protein
MLLDHTSLLVAVGIAASALMVTLLISWLSARRDAYLLLWGGGLALALPAIALFGLEPPTFEPGYFLGGFLLLFASFSLIAAGAQDYRSGRVDIAMLSGLWAISTILTTIAFAFGYSGVGTIIGNLVCATYFGLTAREYWMGRAEARLPLITKTALYAGTALTFVGCALMLAIEGVVVLDARPANWAEDLNAVMLIVSLAGIGALALTLRQLRTAQMHRALALTDPLTGLLNRRAIFEAYGPGMPQPAAVIMLDLDHFKIINDTHGHGAGDAVLVAFAETLGDLVPPANRAARLGGEEFCIVVAPGSAPTEAAPLADRIRLALAARTATMGEHGAVTVSAGVAVPTTRSEDFETLLRRADQALYRAKSNGRNQVQGPLPRLVA